MLTPQARTEDILSWANHWKDKEENLPPHILEIQELVFHGTDLTALNKPRTIVQTVEDLNKKVGCTRCEKRDPKITGKIKS